MRYGFMAGCSLSSTSPERVGQVIADLKKIYPELAVIQACCGKPTKMIGEQAAFKRRFGQLTDKVEAAEIDELIVACQGCIKVMREENQFKTSSLWVKLAEMGLPKEFVGKAQASDVIFSIQDSCPTKDMPEIHEAVRYLLKELGYEVKKSRLTGKNTMCCGMGGMCGVSNPPLAKEIAQKRVHDFKTDHIVTYCASCTSAMQLGGGQAWHLLDLIYGPVVDSTTTCAPHPLRKPLKAWANRYQTKRIIEKG
ncbi:(Fe-S)-binding protein [Enterococcus sp. CSURQ0835]|uniref:(Fe-S)-binding protein n=1 Tax=Enterococcus sp. CSURQ0835 TaxID=2681394 RepID=UPI0013577E94|nr:(Fe-S)-binding protein [Enterococcus sp. CSURQ0835]